MTGKAKLVCRSVQTESSPPQLLSAQRVALPSKSNWNPRLTCGRLEVKSLQSGGGAAR